MGVVIRFRMAPDPPVKTTHRWMVEVMVAETVAVEVLVEYPEAKVHLVKEAPSHLMEEVMVVAAAVVEPVVPSAMIHPALLEARHHMKVAAAEVESMIIHPVEFRVISSGSLLIESIIRPIQILMDSQSHLRILIFTIIVKNDVLFVVNRIALFGVSCFSCHV